ncbi:MAG: hypothetical protein IV090_24415 [Candidatus Sericytochromatia bacterium]|nr:hypothetical protein [Candidatus Sericytochromatia bacterium]
MQQPESTPPPATPPPVSPSSTGAPANSLETQLRQTFPQLTQLSSENWPSGSERLSGQLKWVELHTPQNGEGADRIEQVRERLRAALNAIVVAQAHPESDCIAVQARLENGFWFLRAEIVCR